MDMAGRTYVVTGGASGLGAATAAALIEAGAEVVVADRDAQAGTRLAERLGPLARFRTLDVADDAAVAELFDDLVDRPQPLRGVIQCAGIAPAHRVLGRDGPHPLPLFRTVLEVNLLGTFNVARHAARVMQASTPDADGARGVILNTASIAAFDGQIGQAAYAASKGGVVAMTLPLARELARFGIRVMTIAPGVMETPMMAGMSEEVRAGLAAGIPFPARLGRAREFAALALHVLANAYLNGEVIRLDGGLRMGWH